MGELTSIHTLYVESDPDDIVVKGELGLTSIHTLYVESDVQSP